MKITKVPKRKPEVPEDLAALGARIVEEPESSLASLLRSVDQWAWPRGDLYAWIPVLNRFDDILARICHTTPLKPVQKEPFGAHDRELLLAVLSFTRLLLENCLNRKLYSSYEYIDLLLATEDADVLEQLLYLVLRSAQQRSASNRIDVPLSHFRLRILATVWPPREAGLELVDVAQADMPFPAAMHSVHVNGYRRSPQAADGAASLPSTPAKQGEQDHTLPSLNGTFRVVISGLDTETRPPSALLQACDSAKELSDDEQFELFHKVRVALACKHPSTRHQALVCRLLAVACFIHIAPHAMANTHIFMIEPSIVLRTVALLEPPEVVDDSLHSAVLYALDAFRHYRTYYGDVLTAINASMSHGVLRQLLQCTIQRLSELAPTTSIPSKFDRLVDALITLVANMTTIMTPTSMTISTGLLPQLLDIARIKSTSNLLVLRTSTRAVGLLDTIMYTYPSTFEHFIAIHGIDVLVERLVADMPAPEESEPFMYSRSHLIRQILRTIHHLMTTPGTADGLRTLIDTPILGVLRTIIERKNIFGPHVLTLAISIMSTFVHNEPTQLSTIQESKLPEAFLQALSDGFEPNMELLMSLSTAIGALCLNEAGLRLLTESGIVARILRILNDTRFHGILLDHDCANAFGGSIEELVRHHPSLKEGVLTEVLRVVERIVTEARTFTPPSDAKERELYVVDTPVQLEAKPIRTSHIELDDIDHYMPSASAGEGNAPVGSFDVLCRFLEGLFRNESTCREFMSRDGLAQLLVMYDTPCITPYFPSSAPAESFVMLLRAMTEEDPDTVLSLLLQQVKRSIDEWTPGIVTVDDTRFRAFCRLHARTQLLSDVCQMFNDTFSFSPPNNKIPLAFLRALRRGGDVATIAQLAEVLRSTVWERMTVKAALQDVDQDTMSPTLKAVDFLCMRIPAALRSILLIVTRQMVPRRTVDMEYLTAAKQVAVDLSGVLRSWSSLRTDVSEVEALAEHTYMYLILRHLLYEKRSGHGEYAHTMVLREWCEQGGDAVLVEQVRSLSAYFEHGALDNDETSVMSHAAHALHVYLSMVMRFVPARTLNDSQQSVQLSKDPTFHVHVLLVQLRKHAIDVLTQLWDAPWLTKLPLATVREVAQALGMVLFADREDPSQRPTPAPLRSMSHLPHHAPTGMAMTMSASPLPVRPPAAAPAVDEGRLMQLVEMGFPRGASRRALQRCRNNVSAATEYILLHPELEDEPEAPPPEPAAEPEMTAVSEPDELAQALAGALHAHIPSTEPTRQETPPLPEPAWPTPAKIELDKCREDMRPHFFPRLLELADVHEELVFDARHVFVFFSRDQEQTQRLWHIVTERMTYDTTQPVIMARMHLLALLLTTEQTPFKVPWSSLPPLAHGLLGCLREAATAPDAPEPPWLPSALLALCGVLSACEVPEGVLALPRDAQECEAFLLDVRPKVTEYVLHALAHSSRLSFSVNLSLARALMIVSRHASVGGALVERRAVPLVMRPLLSRRRFQRALYQHLVVSVLRHMVESGGALLSLFTQEVHIWFKQGTRPRPTEVNAMIKKFGLSLLRAPSTFIEAAGTQVDLLDFHSIQSPTHLRTKPGACLADEPAEAHVVRDVVIHMLLDELIAARQEHISPTDEGDVSVADARDSYILVLLQCLTELLSSYMGCKQSFLEYRVNGSESILTYFMNELVPSGFLAQYEPDELRKRTTESNWAISVMVALAADPLPDHEAPVVPDALIVARKTLLDALHKALREAMATQEMVEIKFGRLYALTDMCYRLLTSRPASDAATPRHSGVVLHMAKTMLEKNFVVLLTQAISDLDVHVPSLTSLLNSVLRPLEHLARVAIKMARRDTHARNEGTEDPEEEDDEEDDDVEEEVVMHGESSEDEGTPDFYRNSSLGMHTGEMEQGAYDSDHLSEDLGDDEDMEMEEYNSDDAESELSTDAEDLDGDSTHVVEVVEDDDEEEHDSDNHSQEDFDDMEEDGFSDDMFSDDMIDDEAFDDDELDVRDFDDMQDEEHDMSRTGNMDSVREIMEALNDMEHVPELEDSDHDTVHTDAFDMDLGVERQGADDVSDEDDIGDADDDDGPNQLTWRPTMPRMSQESANVDYNWVERQDGRHGAARRGPPTFFQASAEPVRTRSDSARAAPPSHDASFHPLLVDNNDNDPDREPASWQRAMESYMGANTLQFLESFVQQNVPQGGNASIQIELDPGRGMPRMQITNMIDGPSTRRSMNRRAPSTTGAHHERQPSDAPFDAVAESQRFTPNHTHGRWMSEAHVVYAGASMDMNAAFRRPLIEHLLPSFYARRDREREEQHKSKADSSERPTESKRKHHDMEGHSDDEEDKNDRAGRVTATVHGDTVDLTDTGIDPTFLEALPDELREEALLSQQLNAQMSRQARGIVPDFLNVLPRSLRTELQQFDAPASHSAPASRQTDDQPQERSSEQAPPSTDEPQASPQQGPRESERGRDAIQLLDRASLASLVRLLFLPSVHARTSLLHKLLAHLSVNARTRTELLGMLLMVLWDSMHSAASVDRSFTALCNKAAKHTPQRNMSRHQSSSLTSSGLLPPSTPSAALPLTWMGDEAPHLIASRSLETLTHLAHANHQAALFFLREDRSRKGNKRVPIQILLGLLEKDAMLEHAPLLNELLALLQSVSKPLTTAQPGKDGTGAVLDSTYDNMEVPGIASERLAAIVRPLQTPMTSRAFQHTLAVASHLSHLPGAHESISAALQNAAQQASYALVSHLEAVIASLPEVATDAVANDQNSQPKADAQAPSEPMATEPASSPVPSTSLPLARLASPTSSQAELLRCLRALDYLYMGK